VGKAKPEAEEPVVDVLGQLSVTLDGTEYTLRPSRQAISNIERQTGKTLSALAVQASGFGITVEEMGVSVCEMMRAYAAFDPEASADYKGAKPERCADLVFEAGPMGIARRLAIIFTGALTGGYTASGEPRAIRTTTEPTRIAD
jgi:hypothetical protein